MRFIRKNNKKKSNISNILKILNNFEEKRNNKLKNKKKRHV